MNTTTQSSEKGLEIRQPLTEKNATFNYSYYPLIFNSEQQAVEKFCALQAEGISPRRYFYPALNSLQFVKHGTTPTADDISRRVLCLPLYHEMTEGDVKLISKVLLK